VGKLSNLTHDETLQLAMQVGCLLLENGGTTTKVEDTMFRICHYFGIQEVNVFVTPTFIIMGESVGVGQNIIRRITSRSTNLNVLCKINDFLYGIEDWEMDYNATSKYLKELPGLIYNAKQDLFLVGLGAGMFSMLLGGTVYDFLAAFVTYAVTKFCLKRLKFGTYGTFLENCAAGTLIGALSTLTCALCSKCNIEMVTVGAIMPFLPGLAFTNGLRDVISGNLISGNSRITEAIIFAVSIVVGLGMTMFIILMLQKNLGV